MAGLYIHIPFCKRRCLYCDFFSTTLLQRQEEYLEAVIKEIDSRRGEAGEPIRTVYIGGGTPSTLRAEDVSKLLKAAGAADAEEITMELNPGDATREYFLRLRETGINRLSIGIQSFQDELLHLVGRRHDARQAIEAVRMAQEAGFGNISIDLMYALPTQTMDMWKADIETALSLNVQHISSYGLMYEEGTELTRRRDAGELESIDEDTEMAMYDYLCARLKDAGLVHYEVSNFALPGHEALHNSSYWNGTPYVGVGAGAHSYIGCVRSWNPDDLDAYIQGIADSTLVRESETLSDEDRYNEQVMLGLRTNRGIPATLPTHKRLVLDSFVQKGLLRETEEKRIVATQKGLHVLNRIIEDLMI